MTVEYHDRVRETSTTTGTGTLNLDGAVSGFQSFVAAIGGSSAPGTVPYLITYNNEWEVGMGTIADASPDTLARVDVIASSNSGSVVNFSAGTKQVYLTMPSDALSNWRGNELYDALAYDIAEKIATPTISSGTINIDCSTASAFDFTLTENVTTMNLQNPPASGQLGSITLFITQDGTGGRTITWPASVDTPESGAVDLSATASKMSIFHLITKDGGTNWYLFNGGKEFGAPP